MGATPPKTLRRKHYGLGCHALISPLQSSLGDGCPLVTTSLADADVVVVSAPPFSHNHPTPMTQRRIIAIADPNSPEGHDTLEDYDLELAVKVLGYFDPAVVWQLVLCHKRND